MQLNTRAAFSLSLLNSLVGGFDIARLWPTVVRFRRWPVPSALLMQHSHAPDKAPCMATAAFVSDPDRGPHGSARLGRAQMSSW